MKVTRETIENIADLARLNISDSEIDKLNLEMENILTYMDKLGKLDTSGVIPMEHVIPIYNVLREDEIKASLDREKLLNCSSLHEKGCYKVPKVIE